MAGALATAPVAEAGVGAGVLQAWPAGDRPVGHAVRIDARLVDPTGSAATVSLVLVPPQQAPLFDDPAVSGALRAYLAGPPADAVSTFTRDAVRFAGALTVFFGGRGRADADPFARLHPARVLSIGAGLLGWVPPPPGPGIQRYAGQPWPAEGFAS
ncbi:MAG: hypothetical protein M3Z02_10525 [Actinomycetota bacterium]|nr:hypothetical protein [Actinomycetota bacterium]